MFRRHAVLNVRTPVAALMPTPAWTGSAAASVLVAKKPRAGERLDATAEGGSFGAGRITLDAHRAIVTDGKAVSGS